jgi:hypothetical protein
MKPTRRVPLEMPAWRPDTAISPRYIHPSMISRRMSLMPTTPMGFLDAWVS